MTAHWIICIIDYSLIEMIKSIITVGTSQLVRTNQLTPQNQTPHGRKRYPHKGLQGTLRCPQFATYEEAFWLTSEDFISSLHLDILIPQSRKVGRSCTIQTL